MTMRFSNILKGALLCGGVAVAGLLTGIAPFAGSPASAQSSMQRPAETLVLSIGRGQLIQLPGSMTDLFVADTGVADVQVKSSQQLYVFGKAGGETTLYASNAAGQVVYSATVRVGSNLDSIDQMLTLAMPDAKVRVSTLNGVVLLTGVVGAPVDSAEAERLVQAFVGDDVKVISRLQTATPMQVNLQVRIAEVSRSLVKEIGSNLLTRDTTGGFQFGIGRGNPAASSFGDKLGRVPNVGSLPRLDASSQFGLPEGSLFLPFDPAKGQFVTGNTTTTFGPANGAQTAIQLAGRLFGVDVASAFDLGEQVGLVSTLAQPNLTALSGETAEFLAGGEYPILVPQGLGNVTVKYKNFGVSLAYTPTVLANGRISMRVRPEVSELSTQGAVTLGGNQIPALTTRRAETTIELGSGESFMIAGLLSNNTQNLVDKAPGLGDVPVLGNLFKSSSFRRGETELVIVVTPYLVKPVNANEIKMPTDGFQTPGELERLINHQQSDGISGGERPMPRVAPAEGGSGGPEFGALPAQPRALPSSAAKPQRDAKADKGSSRKKGKDGAMAAATPGFSFE
ncbi:type II and III secretion system protein family protein [Blastomonas sp.]|uniref:type II and III secretion system protein family protein n=1 Tax=Blastomonas sp. TaxID=1909299 RepID=UPI002626FD24|nr:type II and III secretion system protein family protein [Blastomonas sp.]MDM7955031.1 type II and III secretion system protein family protein [Blastomonas sp.]